MLYNVTEANVKGPRHQHQLTEMTDKLIYANEAIDQSIYPENKHLSTVLPE